LDVAPNGPFCAFIGYLPRYRKAELMVQAGDLLAAEAEEWHRRVVIIVDLCRAGNYVDRRVRLCETAL